MNKEEFYKACIKLTPYHEQKTDEYRDNLSHALKTYHLFLQKLDNNQRPDEWNELFLRINKIIDKIKKIALYSYKGLPSTAGSMLSNMMKSYEDKLIWENIPVDTYFYRMRNIRCQWFR